MRSGSLITARLANEMGRDIFALPGSIHAPLSRGCHRIIKQGAKLVETPDEVLEELGFARRAAPRPPFSAAQAVLSSDVGATNARALSGATVSRPSSAPTPTAEASAADPAPAGHPATPRPPLDPEAERLLAALGHSPTTLEILATRTEMEDAALQSHLLQLELAGQVTALPGGRFMRASHG